MTFLAFRAGPPTASRLAAACLFAAFDALTILPAAAGCYVAKRAAHIDVVRNVDMLPDPLIEGAIAAVARQVRKHL